VREVVILLLVIVLAIMVIGAVNQDQHVDFDYVVGTWDNASVLELSAVAAGVVFATGLTCAAIVRGGLIGSRRKLERELQETYVRLRAAESRTQVAATETAGSVSAASASASAASSGGPVPAEAVSADEPPPAAADAGHVHLIGSEAPEITDRTAFPPAEPATETTTTVASAGEQTVVLPALPQEGVTTELPLVEDETTAVKPPAQAGGEDAAAAEGDGPAGSAG
jgi:uncharacterized membrane protein YciS (DUF1049 family)